MPLATFVCAGCHLYLLGRPTNRQVQVLCYVELWCVTSSWASSIADAAYSSRSTCSRLDRRSARIPYHAAPSSLADASMLQSRRVVLMGSTHIARTPTATGRYSSGLGSDEYRQAVPRWDLAWRSGLRRPVLNQVYDRHAQGVRQLL